MSSWVSSCGTSSGASHFLMLDRPPQGESKKSLGYGLRDVKRKYRWILKISPAYWVLSLLGGQWFWPIRIRWTTNRMSMYLMGQLKLPNPLRFSGFFCAALSTRKPRTFKGGNPARKGFLSRWAHRRWSTLVESHRASPHHRCFMLATKNQGSSNFTKWMSYEGSDHWNDPKDTKNMAAKSKTPLSKPMPRASHVAAYWSPPSCREQFLRWSPSLSGSSTKGSNPMTTGPLGPPTDAIQELRYTPEAEGVDLQAWGPTQKILGS